MKFTKENLLNGFVLGVIMLACLWGVCAMYAFACWLLGIPTI